MKLLLLLSTIITIQAVAMSTEEDECDGVTVCLPRQGSLEIGPRPALLVTSDFATKTLFFSYILTESNDTFRSPKINLNTKEYTEIDILVNGFSHTVDQDNHEVHIGCTEGTYRYYYATNKAYDIGITTSNVWDIYVREFLYYSDFLSIFLYIKDSELLRLLDLENTKITKFAIDSDNVMIYANAAGLYSQPAGTQEDYLYKELENSGNVIELANDVKGDVYACFADGIYRVKAAMGTLELVVSI